MLKNKPPKSNSIERQWLLKTANCSSVSLLFKTFVWLEIFVWLTAKASFSFLKFHNWVELVRHFIIVELLPENKEISIFFIVHHPWWFSLFILSYPHNLLKLFPRHSISGSPLKKQRDNTTPPGANLLLFFLFHIT